MKTQMEFQYMQSSAHKDPEVWKSLSYLGKSKEVRRLKHKNRGIVGDEAGEVSTSHVRLKKVDFIL